MKECFECPHKGYHNMTVKHFSKNEIHPCHMQPNNLCAGNIRQNREVLEFDSGDIILIDYHGTLQDGTQFVIPAKN